MLSCYLDIEALDDHVVFVCMNNFNSSSFIIPVSLSSFFVHRPRIKVCYREFSDSEDVTDDDSEASADDDSSSSDDDSSGYDSDESDDDVVAPKRKGRASNSAGSGAGVGGGRSGNAAGAAAGAGSGGDDKCRWKKWVTEDNPHGFSPAALTRLSKLSGAEREKAEQQILKKREENEKIRNDPEKHKKFLEQCAMANAQMRADPEKWKKKLEQDKVYRENKKKQRANNNQSQ